MEAESLEPSEEVTLPIDKMHVYVAAYDAFLLYVLLLINYSLLFSIYDHGHHTATYILECVVL